MTDLLPCPMCGTVAHFFKIDDIDQKDFGGQGICCQTEGCVQIGLIFACMDDPKPTLAEKWNRRDEWRPIETAPHHMEVLVWRADSGVFIAKLTNPEAVITPEEMERENLEFPDDFEEWFCEAHGWQEGSEKPTHWKPLPDGPAE